MTYGELKKRVLQLIFSDTLAGTVIPATYNNQADYINMIPGLVNTGLYDIATTARRIPAEAKLSSLTVTHETYCDVYQLPANCWQMMTGGLLTPDRNRRIAAYRILLSGNLRVDPGMDPDCILEYWRYPNEVSAQTADSTVLDNRPETHEALVFYVAAGLLAYDDPYRAQLFRNEYELRKKSLREPVWMEQGVIANIYQGE